jgi:xanthine dehydrogenase accessory factor
MKIGDLDPRANREHCFTISDKALAVGGGVLEAVLAAPQIRTRLWTTASHETPSGV